ncbi:FAD-dependent pyridine nucleotide-disulfide oxidoreductase [Rhizobium sp. Root149]|uniref:FAD/NAD(P)-binding protein n=1 Tax=Rhizobium sp. Root149 TaxID=1736473 RepID=UPI0007139D38|nr:FAD/NAD(P)-binding protein [Rhizobium sp. Root149]KQZ49790.1 FAD-dependent pyridine nucleotide-disulfide oxidoreductase [Rhizobium sp. Root149]
MKYDVAVVGAGFSAIAVTLQLLRKLSPHQSVAVIGDDPGFGRGTAYRSEFHIHRLNVAAARMSIFPDRPDDFLNWQMEKGRSVKAGDYVPRSDFGLYLRDRLAELLRQRQTCARVDFIKAKALGCLDIGADTTMIRLAHGGELVARNLVLCLGVGSASIPAPLRDLPETAKSHVVENPWRLGWLSKVGANDRVCILGSGLTMVDQVLALRASGHQGMIHVLSRRGLLPHRHDRQPVSPVPPELPETDRRMSKLLAALRKQVRRGALWRSVIDGLRPHTQTLWQELPDAEKKRFLRHAVPWWTVHRHRLAPDVADDLDRVLDDGRLTVHAGYLQQAELLRPGIGLSYRARGSRETRRLTADWIVNCTGMERAGIDHSPLLQCMEDRGQLQPDPLGLGIMVDETSRLIGRDGQPQHSIHVVGALTAGRFWEITAVPDIRVQANAVAAQIAAELASSPASDVRAATS